MPHVAMQAADHVVTLSARYSCLRHFIPHIEKGGLNLEFGVAKGVSIRILAELLEGETIYGFDLFQGLPEDFDQNLLKGEFACERPDVPANVVLIEGYFHETLARFLQAHRGRVSFVHMDADLYSSTKFVLSMLAMRLDRAVIVFDEIRGTPSNEQNEEKAFREFLRGENYTADLIKEHHEFGAGYKLSKIDAVYT